MEPLDALSAHLKRFLSWRDAHADFDAAVADLPPDARGVAPPGLPYSPWQLLEHIRLTQADILAFCQSANYSEPSWPDDYWPATPVPADSKAWDASIAAYRRDHRALQPNRKRHGRTPFPTTPLFGLLAVPPPGPRIPPCRPPDTTVLPKPAILPFGQTANYPNPAGPNASWRATRVPPAPKQWARGIGDSRGVHARFR